MKTMRMFIAGLVLLTAPLQITSCTMFDKSPVKPPVELTSTPPGQNTGVPKPGAQPNAMPTKCFLLNVPWMPQVAPGDWDHTKNCGQACCVMMGGYYNGGVMQPWVIRAENGWLGYPASWIENGDPGGTGQDRLLRLLQGFHHLNSTIYQGTAAEQVVAWGAMGMPVIVGVRTRMTTNGAPHWMVFTGWDGTYMYFNDPGRSSMSADWTAGHFRCRPDQFYASWSSFPTKPRIYMPVYR